MMKKKTLATLLTLTMLTTAAVPAIAFGEDKTTDTQNIELTYKVDSTFTVTIPAETALTNGKGSSTVSVSDAVIPFGQSLNITIASTNYETNSFRLKDGANDNYIKYTIKNGATGISNNETILSVNSDNATGSVTLDYEAEQAKKAGTYKDQLTFTAAVAPTV